MTLESDVEETRLERLHGSPSVPKWQPGRMAPAVYISLCAALVVMAPVWMTDRSFGGDWWLHLRLIELQRVAWLDSLHPTLTASIDPVGALTPLPMMFGAVTTAIGGGLAALGLGSQAAYVILHIAVTWAAFFGMWWVARLAGAGRTASYAPAIVLVTSAFFLGDPLGRGGFGQFAATQTIPLLIAGVADVLVNRRVRLRSALAVFATTPIVVGGHTVSTLWTLTITATVIILLAAFLWRFVQDVPGRSKVLLLGVFVSGCLTTVWSLAPLLTISGSLGANDGDFSQSAARYFGNPAIWLNPFRVVPQEHIDFWRIQVEGAGYVFQGGTSLLVQAPVLALIWTIWLSWRIRHVPCVQRTLSKVLWPVLLAMGLLMTFPELWNALPRVFLMTQYPFRLMGYIQLLICLLMALAIGGYQRHREARLPRGSVKFLIGILVICSVQSIWQGWSVVNFTAGWGYDVARTQALEDSFVAKEWYDVKGGRYLPNGVTSEIKPTIDSNFTSDNLASWQPDAPVSRGATITTPVVAPPKIIAWTDAAEIGRTADGFAVIRVTGSNPSAVISSPTITLAGWTSLGALVVGLLLLMGAWLEGRRGPPPRRTRPDQVARRPARRKLTVVALALAVTGAFAAAVAALVPHAENTRQYEFPLNALSSPVEFVSATQSPQNLQVTVPCASANSLDPGRSVVALGTARPGQQGLVLRLQPGLATFGLEGNPQFQTSIVVPAEGCQVLASYDDATRTIALEVPGAKEEVRLDQTESATRPRLSLPYSELIAPATASLVFKTYLTTLSPSPVHSAAVLVAALCGLMLIALLAIGRTGSRRSTSEPFTKNLRVLNGLVLAGLSVLAVLVPPGFDDGWVLTTVRAREALGFFSNYFSGGEAIQPQGAWWNVLQSTYATSLYTSPVVMRLPLVLAAWFTWLVVLKCVALVRGAYPSRSTSATAAVFFVSGSAAFLTGLRPEALVALLLAATFYLVIDFGKSSHPLAAAGAFTLGGLSISLHQSGLAVAATALGATPALVRHFGQWRLCDKIAVISGPVLISAAALTLPGSLRQIWAGTQAFRDFPEYNRQMDELARWGELLADQPNGMNPIRVLIPLVCLGVTILAVMLIRATNLNCRNLVLLALLPWAGLALTASKWTWHFGVLIPVVTLLLLALLDEWRGMIAGRQRWNMGLVVAFAALGFNVSQRSLDWTQGFDAPRDASGFLLGISLIDPTSLVFWGCLAALGIIAVHRGWILNMAGRGLSVMLSIVLLLSLGPILVDGWQRPYSWLGQQIASMSGNHCGLGEMTTATDLRPLEGWLAPTGLLPTTASSDLRLPTAPPSTLAYTATAAGGSGTPWFRVTAGQSLQGWMKSITPVEATVDFTGAFGQAIESTSLSVSRADAWQIWQVNAPDAAAYVRVRWSGPAGAAFTEPLQVVGSRKIKDLPAKTVWANPQIYFQATCDRPADISAGEIPPLDISIGLPQWEATQRALQKTPVQLACPSDDPELAANTCVYGFTDRRLVQ